VVPLYKAECGYKAKPFCKDQVIKQFVMMLHGCSHAHEHALVRRLEVERRGIRYRGR
jgi:hypothetical protein